LDRGRRGRKKSNRSASQKEFKWQGVWGEKWTLVSKGVGRFGIRRWTSASSVEKEGGAPKGQS